MPTNAHKNKRKGFIIPLIAVFLALMTVAAAVLLPIMAISSRFRHQGDPLNQVFGGGLQGVPEPYGEIFVQAGGKFGVQPAFIAAIFYAGEWHNAWKESPWPSSPVGASGPFQFMPGTWSGKNGVGFLTNPDEIARNGGQGKDGDGDGIADVQNLWDAAFSASYKLSVDGAGGNTTDEAKLMDAASRYNSGQPWDPIRRPQETKEYVPRVMVAFQQFYAEAAMAPGGANRIVAIAQGELGVSCPNDICPKYGGANGQRWCAFFVSWVYNQAGFPMNPVKIGSVDAMYNYFQQNHQIIPPSGSPAPGDVAFFSEYSHVAIVESVQGNIITYIAGNNRNDKVAREEISKTGIRGYGRW